jgi:hypothetical protein
MNKLLKTFLAVAAVSAIAAPAMAQSSATQSTTASATIVQPITLTKNSDLAFGTVVKPTSGTNTITIDETTGGRTKTGAGDAALATSSPTRAAFSVGGEGGQTFSITVPSTATMTRSGGSETLTANLVKTAATGTISGSIGSAGTATFGVGGNYDVSSTTVSGAYSGSFNTTFDYN